MKARDYNLYQDEHTGGWVLEILALGDWYVYGVFGTRSSAMDAIL